MLVKCGISTFQILYQMTSNVSKSVHSDRELCCQFDNDMAVSVSDRSDLEKHSITYNIASLNGNEYKRNLIITNKDSFKWFGDFEDLQMLFNNILNGETSWSKPGGGCRKLEVNQLTVRWYSDTNSLTISGSKDEEIKSCSRDLAKEAVDHADMNTYSMKFIIMRV